MTRVALVTVAAAVLTLATVVWPWSSSWSSGRWEGGGRWAWPRVVRPAHEDAGEEGSPPWTPARWRPGSARRSSRRWSPPQFGRARRARRDAERRSVAVLDLLDALAPALRAGLPPPAALRAIAHPSPERRSALLVALLEAADRAEDLAPVWRPRRRSWPRATWASSRRPGRCARALGHRWRRPSPRSAGRSGSAAPCGSGWRRHWPGHGRR